MSREICFGSGSSFDLLKGEVWTVEISDVPNSLGDLFDCSLGF